MTDISASPAPGVTMNLGGTAIPHPNTDLGDPFSGDCHEFTLTKSVDVGQLTEEIIRSLKPAEPPQLVLQLTNNSQPTQGSPALLWVSPSRLNRSTLQEVINRHTPINPSGPVADDDDDTEQPATASPVALTSQQQTLVGRLQEGDTLDAAECSDLLRALLGVS